MEGVSMSGGQSTERIPDHGPAMFAFPFLYLPLQQNDLFSLLIL
jgi:hypothetical protein